TPVKIKKARKKKMVRRENQKTIRNQEMSILRLEVATSKKDLKREKIDENEERNRKQRKVSVLSKFKHQNPTIAQNRKARHDFDILETIEAGIVLRGTEIKSIRKGSINLQDGFAGFRGDELFLYNVHISPFKEGNQFNHDPL